VPIRVSYHGRNHYNAVVPHNWAPLEHRLVKEVIGVVEEYALRMAVEHP